MESNFKTYTTENLQKKEISIDKLILSMLNAITTPPSEREYKIFNISKINFLKRREFSNIYKTLILFLIRLSVPKAFPKEASDILSLFNLVFEMAYKEYPIIKQEIEKDLKKFEELVDFKSNSPFLKLSLYIAEKFEKKPRKAVYAVLLNQQIENIFENFVALGGKVKIIYEKSIDELY